MKRAVIAAAWGKPASTLSQCTAAYGMISVQQDDNFTAFSSKRC